VEGLIALSPDLVVTNFFMNPDGERDLLVERLRDAGISVIFSDASTNADIAVPFAGPLEALHAQLRLWGTLLGNPAKAEAFLSFFDTHVAALGKRLAGAEPVTTYLEVQSTIDDCCWSAGNRIWGRLLELAGGRTLPAVTAPWFQKLALEYLLTTPHDVYIASGGEWASGGRPAIGPGLDPAQAKAGLQRLIQRTGFDQIDSVRAHRVHGIWTGLITVPAFNVLFVEIVAKWLHPERCRDLDPEATLVEINSRFMSTPVEKPLWVSLQN
jgi:iron complex transport system substrate-binding protein